MEGIGGVIKRRAEAAKRKPERKTAQLPGIESREPAKERYMHSEAHVLAAEISSHFAERKKFGVYLAIIRRIGVPQARTIFASIKSGDANVDNPRKFFMWVTRKERRPEDAAPKKSRKKGPVRRKPKKSQLDMNDILG